jgi:hypothetical protein
VAATLNRRTAIRVHSTTWTVAAQVRGLTRTEIPQAVLSPRQSVVDAAWGGWGGEAGSTRHRVRRGLPRPTRGPRAGRSSSCSNPPPSSSTSSGRRCSNESANIRAVYAPRAATLLCLAGSLVLSACGGGRSPTKGDRQIQGADIGVLMKPVPRSAWSSCVQGWLLRPACPRSVPVSGSITTRPNVVAGCSGGPTMTNVPLASRQCRFAQWSYLTYGSPIPGTQNGLVVEASELTPPPPYFVHVLVYGTTDVSALGFALPRGRPRPLTDALLQRTNRRRAVLISRVVWAGRAGELILAPSFPAGGEMGSHLIFSYRTGRIYRGISLHPWPSVYHYRVDYNRVARAVKLAPSPAYPEIETTLRRIVESSG